MADPKRWSYAAVSDLQPESSRSEIILK